MVRVNLRAAAEKEHSDVVIASSYVNPTQFAVHEDFGQYPREKHTDREKLMSAGCDAVFEPVSLYAPQQTEGADNIFVVGQPPVKRSHQTFVSVERLERPLCGKTRPHFFRGVATICAKLFNIVEPDVAVFGLKDYQQFRVIKTMIRELNFGIELVGGPILREPDGLAMSSRNALLHAEVRPKCIVLHQSLQWAEQILQSRGRMEASPSDLICEIQDRISAHGGLVDYVKIVDPETLEDVTDLEGRTSVVVAVAAFFQNKARLPHVRLIDNAVVSLKQ